MECFVDPYHIFTDQQELCEQTEPKQHCNVCRKIYYGTIFVPVITDAYSQLVA